LRRPAIALRRLSATLTSGRFTVDLGKQFIRWGKTDIVTPTDRLAPRDFLNVVDAEFLPVAGVRAVADAGANRVEGVFVPVMTPSRIPLLDQRWTVFPEGTLPAGPPVSDVTARLPRGVQGGARWEHTGAGYEYSLSWFDGFETVPNIDVAAGSRPGQFDVMRVYPAIRSYGADTAVPLRWFTLKSEGAFVVSSTPGTDDYVLLVVQLERQSGEWLFLGGYASEIVTARRAPFVFSPDRGLTRAVVGRASRTLDANRSVSFESAVRQNLDGLYVKGEYTQARGSHWRATVSGALIAGKADDFLGRYRRNSYLTISLRFSY
jgi:hypothetical protein